jgi:hypothetical protein
MSPPVTASACRVDGIESAVAFKMETWPGTYYTRFLVLDEAQCSQPPLHLRPHAQLLHTFRCCCCCFAMRQMCAWKSLRAAKHLHVHIQSGCLVADVDDLWPACAPLLLTSLAMTDSAATADIHRSRRCLCGPAQRSSCQRSGCVCRLHQDASRRLLVGLHTRR